ncbi:complement regulator-acquiring protein (plasmid) [Borrelia anserina]|uniref:Antigen P35 n=2 Tax=Borrelia anserina TaxID=143 RepID=A0ABN4UEH7_BORAN|nr:complement regulator-acquiring protein [Borrelia anserina]APR65327.1 hypothetical protein N187_A08 [Borrelia anserina Es]UPA07295.1 complement regulator-acquiring protein [Borrelia anserina]
MKYRFLTPFLTSILSLLTLGACNLDPTKPNDTLNNHPKNISINKSKIETNALSIKKNLIHKIKSKVTINLELINKKIAISTNKIGIQNAIFDENYYKNMYHQLTKIHSIDKDKIRLFSASLNHNLTRLKEMEKILIQIRSINTQDGNKLYKEILETGIEYNQKTFEDLIQQINKEQYKLPYFNTAQLKEVTNNLETIENLRNTWIEFIDSIINDYKNDTAIQKDTIKLITHINTQHKARENKIHSIKDVVQKTKKMLNVLKYQYYINKQIKQN